MSIEIRTLPVQQIQPAAYNPRKILKPKDAAYQKLVRSIQEFGLVEPLIWNERSGNLVGGHARLAILKQLGYTEIPVSVVQLTPAQEKALNIVLNNREAQGRFDVDKLESLLVELKDLPEFAATGFELSDLQQLQFEPTPMEAEAQNLPIRITIECEEAILQELQPRLDDWLQQYPIRCHVQR